MRNKSEKLILTEIKNRVGTIWLNRPESLNAFNLELAVRLRESLDALSEEKNVRVIVLRGKGYVFSVGGDVKEMLKNVQKDKDPAAYFREPLSEFHRIILALRECPKPVLAAVHGAVAGYAFNLVLACDLKLATDATRFLQAFIRLGLSPDGGGTHLLPRLIGYSRACELTMLPDEIDARKAREWGLINWTVPEEEFEPRVRETADRLARGPSWALAQTKRLLNRSWDTGLKDQLEAERQAQVENSTSADFEEGLSAFIEKREPEFSP